MSEIAEAIQVIKVTLDGVDMTFKVGTGGIVALKKLLEFIYNMLKYEKLIGKTSMKKMLERGGDLQVFQFEKGDLKKIEKYAKQYGILYSIPPRTHEDDGMMEIIFHTEATPRMNMLIQKLKSGKISDLEEYVEKADLKSSEGKEQVEKQVGEFLNKKIETLKDSMNGVKLLESHKGELSQVAERVKGMELYHNPELIDIVLTKELYCGETDSFVKMKIPNKENKFLFIPKENIIKDGEEVIAFLQKEQKYELCNDQGIVVEELLGKELCAKHYRQEKQLYNQYADKEIKEYVVDVRALPDTNITPIIKNNKNTDKSVSSVKKSR